MTYTPPTAADLQAQFPAFAAVPEPSVTYWLTRAARIVDESWTEDDFAHARMLLAAHYMAENGLGTSADAVAVANGTAGFKSIRSGALSLERADSAQSASAWGGTTFGRQFATLLSVNRGGPRVTGSGTICGYPFGHIA